MDLIKKIIESDLHINPWPHKLIDDFFEREIFEEIKKFSQISIDTIGVGSGQPIDPHSLIQIKSLLDPVIYNNILEINSQLLRHTDDIAKTFPYYRKYGSYYSLPSFHFLKPNSGIHAIHDEVIDKTISIVVYIHPDRGLGTKLYHKKTIDSLHSEVEWKPNRALIFCGQENVTWHDFGTDERPRATVNFFMMKNPITKYIEQEDGYLLVDDLGESKFFKKTGETQEIIRLYDSRLIRD
jgi:hypothetical protein